MLNTEMMCVLVKGSKKLPAVEDHNVEDLRWPSFAESAPS